MNKFSLSQKALVSVFIILLPISLTFLYGYKRNKEQIKSTVIKEMTVVAEAYEGQVYQYMEMTKRRAEDFSSDGYIKERLKEINKGKKTAATLLSQHLSRNKIIIDTTIQVINIISLDGRVAASTEEGETGKDLSGETFFLKGIKGSSVTEEYRGITGVPELIVTAPILDTETRKPIGVIANSILLSELSKLLTGEFNKELGAVSWAKGRHKTMEAYLVNKDKLMLTKSMYLPDSVLKQMIDTVPVQECLGSNTEISDFYVNYRGVQVAGASMCLPIMKWTLVVEMDEEEVVAPADEMLKGALLTAVIVGGLIIALYFLLLKHILRPLGKIAKASELLAGGDYDVRIPVKTSDEIGGLSGAFNRMARDIKERNLELNREKELARKYLDIAGVVIVALGSDERVLLINKKGSELLGRRVEDIQGLNWFDSFVPESIREDLRRRFRGFLAGEDLSYYENPVNTVGGEERMFAWYNTVILTEDGAVTGTLSSGEDITERRRAEDALRLSEEKYRKLFEDSKDVIFIGTRDGKVVDVNPAAEDLLGYTRDELLNIHIKDFYDDPAERELFKKEIERHGFVRDFEVTLKKKDGTRIFATITANAVKDRTGNISAYRGIIHDLTRHKELESQLLQAQKMEAIGQLTGGIAHDFNNILTAIMSSANLLEMIMEKNPKQMRYVRQIISSADRAANLTRGLLAFSRKTLIELKPVMLNEIISSLAKLLSRLIGEDVRFSVTLTPSDPIVTADVGQIEQVIMNLVTNARDAMPSGGILTIKTDVIELSTDTLNAQTYMQPGRYAVISVSDTGTGMDKKTRDKIFDPFFTTKEVGKGTGLGLAIAYGIIKQHGGYINVYSELYNGTEFKIYLPLAEATSVKGPEEALETPVGGNEKVLLAEDDEEVRILTRALLEEFGYRVIEAVDGEDAVLKYAQNRAEIDLLILDVIMPRKNGKEAYGEIIKINPRVKAMFLSGYTEDIINKKGILEEGLNFYIKPISASGLLRKIREVLDK
ncbi:MAG: PAS domain S-box protein [Deltaproteobacteria bacterium]|nr:PAS domain S-box protein [Deltaproteobacteria bacterium]